MNKRCTNSSCRKTFSTLTYGGICPFCGKRYPQLVPSGCNQRRISMRIDGKRVVFKVGEVEHYRRQKRLVKAIKSITREFQRHGYTVSYSAAKDFYDSLDGKRKRMDKWKEISDPKTGDRRIVPVYLGIKHR